MKEEAFSALGQMSLRQLPNGRENQATSKPLIFCMLSRRTGSFKLLRNGKSITFIGYEPESEGAGVRGWETVTMSVVGEVLLEDLFDFETASTKLFQVMSPEAR